MFQFYCLELSYISQRVNTSSVVLVSSQISISSAICSVSLHNYQASVVRDCFISVSTVEIVVVNLLSSLWLAYLLDFILGVPWTEEEHKLFLLGLQKVGKGDWRGISRNFVKTRTPTQVASHAQKYFLRRTNLNRRRRRSSLFDITTDSVFYSIANFIYQYQ